MSNQRRFLRSLEAGRYLEVFLVTAVATVLITRFYLHITGYPQVGGAVLHVAHVLWGGLLMAVGIVVLFTFLSRYSTWVGVTASGIGFGLFIDEVGKFLTKDNNYFFQPAVAVMYVTIVLIYLGARAIVTSRRYTQEEYLLNALRDLEEVAMDDLDPGEQERLLQRLEKSDPGNPLVPALTGVVQGMNTVASRTPGSLARAGARLRDAYARLTRSPAFEKGLVIFFLAQLAVGLTYVLGLVFLRDVTPEQLLDRRVLEHVADRTQDLGFAEKAQIGTSLVSAAFTLMGVMRIRKSRITAYRYFRSSVLVNLLVTQVFVFAEKQFEALVGFAFNLLVLAALEYMLDRELSGDEELVEG